MSEYTCRWSNIFRKASRLSVWWGSMSSMMEYFCSKEDEVEMEEGVFTDEEGIEDMFS